MPDGVASNLALAEAGGMHNIVVGSACGFLVGGIYAVHLECELCAEAFALGETAYLYILAELLIEDDTAVDTVARDAVVGELAHNGAEECESGVDVPGEVAGLDGGGADGCLEALGDERAVVGLD